MQIMVIVGHTQQPLHSNNITCSTSGKLIPWPPSCSKTRNLVSRGAHIDRGIQLSSKHNGNIESFFHFPLPPNQITPFTDANWGPQDQSKPNPTMPNIELEIFKTRSMSGLLIMFNGPIHWVSKCQKVTA